MNARKGPLGCQKSSANTNDLRGKIIRIKPQPNGTIQFPKEIFFQKAPEKPGLKFILWDIAIHSGFQWIKKQVLFIGVK